MSVVSYHASASASRSRSSALGESSHDPEDGPAIVASSSILFWTDGRLGLALDELYNCVVIDGVRDAQRLRGVFEAVDDAARATDPETKARAIVAHRNHVQLVLDVMQAEPAVFRPTMDRCIRALLDIPRGDVTWIKWIRRYVARCMLQFMQGITMFASRDAGAVIGRPAYHRPSSCGPYDAASGSRADSAALERDNLTCHASLSPEELERRRRNVWTCLIERLAYDSIYKHFIGPQDVGHMHNELRVTRQLFETCFMLSRIHVSSVRVFVDPYTDTPVSMGIRYTTPEYVIEEKYSRHAPRRGENYGMAVSVWHARREVRPIGEDGPGDLYHRSQSYLQAPSGWLPVDLRGGKGCRRHATGTGKWKANCPGAPDPWIGPPPTAGASRARRGGQA